MRPPTSKMWGWETGRVLNNRNVLLLTRSLCVFWLSRCIKSIEAAAPRPRGHGHEAKNPALPASVALVRHHNARHHDKRHQVGQE